MPLLLDPDTARTRRPRALDALAAAGAALGVAGTCLAVLVLAPADPWGPVGLGVALVLGFGGGRHPRARLILETVGFAAAFALDDARQAAGGATDVDAGPGALWVALAAWGLGRAAGLVSDRLGAVAAESEAGVVDDG